MSITLDDAIKGYITLRDRRDEIKKRHTEELKAVNDNLYKLQNWIQQQLQTTGQESARTASGTAFLQQDLSVAIEEWPAILTFIQQHGLWEMLEKRVAKTVIRDYIDSTHEVPPGLKVTGEISCHIRRS